MTLRRRTLAAAFAVLPVLTTDVAAAERPNILFVIMDDVGIDQMQVFGYGGLTAPRMPSIGAVAGAGLRFRNVWAMPECSPSRAVFFDGRYPLRTNVLGAIGPLDLANSHVSPFETTTPRVLRRAGYQSGLFGKFHLGGPENNAAGNGAPRALGWDYFYGYVGGLPGSIDSTAGGVAASGTWGCGFVSDGTNGACRFADGRCQAGLPGSTPGRACLEQGGILVPGATCDDPAPAGLSFQTHNAFYVSPLVINHQDGRIEEVPPTDPRSRVYRTTAEVDAARDWINSRPADRPWMATVSFSANHTPLQQTPESLLPPGTTGTSGIDCTDVLDQRTLSNLTMEAMDAEIGRLLVETGLAQRGPGGQLVYDPAATDTMVLIVGDNGSLGGTVKAPFDPTRAKGTSYQTGVWVPLIIAGPLVQSPDRVVRHMVNVADLYQLFGEIAGVDVRQGNPRTVDSRPMLPYLTNPLQNGIRTTNFTQSGVNLTANGARNGPCVINVACTHVPTEKRVCEDNNGIWWGAGADDPVTAGIPPEGLRLCCDVNRFRHQQGESLYDIQADKSAALRNRDYKLVRTTTRDYDPGTDSCVDVSTNEFYVIDEGVPVPRLDRDGANLLPGRLSPVQQRNYDRLTAEMDALLASEPECPGDGDRSGAVDVRDLARWSGFSGLWGLSSVYDFDLDGVTDGADRAVIEANLGTRCVPVASSLRPTD